MPIRARLYINSTILVGLALLAGCLVFERQITDLPRYLSYLLLACVSSTLKIKLPKLRGTMSVNFVFILIGVAQMNVAETITLGGLAALVQCFWRPRKRPAAIQVLFNISTLISSIAISYGVSHALGRGRNAPVLLAIAVCSYFVLNTGAVSLVMSLTENQPLSRIWRQCYLWSFPYYLVGAAIACAIVMTSKTVGWQASLLILPTMYLTYSYYRLYLSQETEPVQVRAATAGR
jgi:hypothetical protein